MLTKVSVRPTKGRGQIHSCQLFQQFFSHFGSVEVISSLCVVPMNPVTFECHDSVCHLNNMFNLNMKFKLFHFSNQQLKLDIKLQIMCISGYQTFISSIRSSNLSSHFPLLNHLKSLHRGI